MNLSPLWIAPIAVIAGLLIWWMTRGGEAVKGQRRTIDVEVYRQAYKERLEGARRVKQQRAQRVKSDAGVRDAGAFGVSAEEARVKGVMSLIEPQCILGPAELCDALRDSVVDCGAGDGAACLAVGQYLADTPPRPLMAISYFMYACRSGEPEGCARMEATKVKPEGPCEDDVFACGWWGYRQKDEGVLDDACAAGMADACAWMIDASKGNPARERGYLEIACQLGNPMTCQELARRLSPGCKPEPDLPCYAPEPAEAEAARTIACEAGFC